MRTRSRGRSDLRDRIGEFDPESDAVLLQSGHATLTALSGVGEAALPPGFANASAGG